MFGSTNSANLSACRRLPAITALGNPVSPCRSVSVRSTGREIVPNVDTLRNAFRSQFRSRSHFGVSLNSILATPSSSSSSESATIQLQRTCSYRVPGVISCACGSTRRELSSLMRGMSFMRYMQCMGLEGRVDNSSAPLYKTVDGSLPNV